MRRETHPFFVCALSGSLGIFEGTFQIVAKQEGISKYRVCILYKSPIFSIKTGSYRDDFPGAFGHFCAEIILRRNKIKVWTVGATI
jgi:hypothetical protein